MQSPPHAPTRLHGFPSGRPGAVPGHRIHPREGPVETSTLEIAPRRQSWCGDQPAPCPGTKLSLNAPHPIGFASRSSPVRLLSPPVLSSWLHLLPRAALCVPSRCPHPGFSLWFCLRTRWDLAAYFLLAPAASGESSPFKKPRGAGWTSGTLSALALATEELECESWQVNKNQIKALQIPLANSWFVT